MNAAAKPPAPCLTMRLNLISTFIQHFKTIKKTFIYFNFMAKNELILLNS